MNKFFALFTLPALLFLGCGGYEEVFENGKSSSSSNKSSSSMNLNSSSSSKSSSSMNILHNKCHDYQYDRSSQYCDDGVIKDKEEFTDVRDGKTYKHKYVKIGEQTWMAENLKYEAPNTKCYDDYPDNCEIFGRMYDWETAKTICPNGWHLPDDNEFDALANFVETASGCVNCAGIMLRANSDLWISNKGEDEFGFTALPGGVHRDGAYSNKGINADSWSATEGRIQGSAHYKHFDNMRPGMLVDGLYTNNSWTNVRCVMD